ncbi:MAG TPA: hypothetical protein VD927_10900 [Chryseosolibacter sp.]|nr:hypothetical protein [Chryseosolibacter sp.]
METMSNVIANRAISRSASITLQGPINEVFPLFGPIREMVWAEGWQPEVLNGKSDMEKHIVFKTQSQFEDESCYLWALTSLIPQQMVEYTVSARDRVWFITVNCNAINENQTMATVTYSYCAASEAAVDKNLIAMNRIFAQNLNDWQDAINHFLATGEKLT